MTTVEPVEGVEGPFQMFADGGRLWFVGGDGAIAIDREQHATVFRLAGVDLSLCAGDCSPEAAVDFLDEITTTTAPPDTDVTTTTLPPPEITLPPVVPDHVDHDDRATRDHRAAGRRPPATAAPTPVDGAGDDRHDAGDDDRRDHDDRARHSSGRRSPPTVPPSPTRPEPPDPPDPPDPPPTPPPTTAHAPTRRRWRRHPRLRRRRRADDRARRRRCSSASTAAADQCIGNGGIVAGGMTIGTLTWSGAGEGSRSVAVAPGGGAGAETIDVQPGELSVTFSVCNLSASIGRTVQPEVGADPVVSDISISGTAGGRSAVHRIGRLLLRPRLVGRQRGVDTRRARARSADPRRPDPTRRRSA